MIYREIQKFSKILRSKGGGVIKKRILYYLYCTKYDEINISHSVVQKYATYTGSYKIFLIYYGLRLETARNVFSIVFHGLLLLN